MSHLNLEPPDDGTILEIFDSALADVALGVFDDVGEPEVIDHDYSEQKSLVQIILQKWVDW